MANQIDFNKTSKIEFKQSLDPVIDNIRVFIKNVKVKKLKDIYAYQKKVIDSIEKIYEKINYLNSFHFDSESKDIKKVEKIKAKLYALIYKYIVISEEVLVDEKYVKDDLLEQQKIVSVKNVTKYYASKKLTNKVLSNISFEINYGDFVVFLGPSGSGKTTIMNLISGIDNPTYGNINVNGYELEKMDQKALTAFRKNVIGYIFQRYGLLPNLTVFENVLVGSYLGKEDIETKIKKLKELWSSNGSKRQQKIEIKKQKYLTHDKEVERILNILKSFELQDFKDKYPYQLSGGQKQRTSIARSIAKNPLIIFGDEPTAAVDAEMSQLIIESVVKINNDLKTTIIMITHDESIAKYANLVFYLVDGKIVKKIYKNKNQNIDIHKV